MLVVCLVVEIIQLVFWAFAADAVAMTLHQGQVHRKSMNLSARVYVYRHAKIECSSLINIVPHIAS